MNKFTSKTCPGVINAKSKPFFHHSEPAVSGTSKKGFTLIELLVVVLIIGILASVALPQYRMAVDKSRVSTLFPLTKSIADAQKLYYMGNGVFAEEFSALDISLPPDCTYKQDAHYKEIAKCAKMEFHITSAAKHVQGILHLSDSSQIWLEFPVTQSTSLECMASGGDETKADTNADKICKSLGGTFSRTSAGVRIYPIK